MFGKNFRNGLATVLVLSSVMTFTQCEKTEVDSDGCYSNIQVPLDSAYVPPIAHIQDSIPVVVFGSADNYCYSHYKLSVEGSGDKRTVTGTADFNSCINCAQARKKMVDSFRVKATQLGDLTFYFKNNTGGFFKTVNVQN